MTQNVSNRSLRFSSVWNWSFGLDRSGYPFWKTLEMAKLPQSLRVDLGAQNVVYCTIVFSFPNCYIPHLVYKCVTFRRVIHFWTPRLSFRSSKGGNLQVAVPSTTVKGIDVSVAIRVVVAHFFFQFRSSCGSG